MTAPWGDLTDADAGRTITFQFPWETDPTTAVFSRAGYDAGLTDDGVDRRVNFIDYGGDVGVQATQFPVTTPIEVEA